MSDIVFSLYTYRYGNTEKSLIEGVGKRQENKLQGSLHYTKIIQKMQKRFS